MSEQTKAVFVSYTSQDADAAHHICEALQAGGIEVWFDKSELRGGDTWDRKIRKQIRECGLFLAVISANTNARPEGYFRLEWRLAVERSHLMADDEPFLIPVAIDSTLDAEARVPDRFREVQWTRLTGAEVPPAFVERVTRLLRPELASASSGSRALDKPAVGRSARIATHLVTSPTQRLLKWWWLGVLAAAVGIGWFAFDRLVSSRRTFEPSPPSIGVAAAQVVPIPRKSVAVLAFTDMSEKHDQEYFSDGLSEELIDLLAKVPDLRVPARTSSFSFKGKTDDASTIAQKLRVANLLEGSVRKAGNRLRVTAQLIQAEDGYHLWSETYDRDYNDIFKVQDEIAGAVVAALKAKLNTAQLPASRRNANAEAYTQVLLARQFFDRGTDDGLNLAVTAYRKAIVLDPGYAAAHAGLSFAASAAAYRTADAALTREAQAAAEQAVALAPDEADGYLARSEMRQVDYDWPAARSDILKALELDPGDSKVQLESAWLDITWGRFADALPAVRKAIELDPLSPSAWSALAYCNIAGDDYKAANESIHRAFEIAPESDRGFINLGTLQLLEGKASEALVSFRKIGFEPYRLRGVAAAEFALGHQAESKLALETAIDKDSKISQAGRVPGSAHAIADIYAWRGDKDKAFEWLNRSLGRHEGAITLIKTNPFLRSLHPDPRFGALLEKLGIPE